MKAILTYKIDVDFLEVIYSGVHSVESDNVTISLNLKDVHRCIEDPTDFLVHGSYFRCDYAAKDCVSIAVVEE